MVLNRKPQNQSHSKAPGSRGRSLQRLLHNLMEMCSLSMVLMVRLEMGLLLLVMQLACLFATGAMSPTLQCTVMCSSAHGSNTPML